MVGLTSDRDAESMRREEKARPLVSWYRGMGEDADGERWAASRDRTEALDLHQLSPSHVVDYHGRIGALCEVEERGLHIDTATYHKGKLGDGDDQGRLNVGRSPRGQNWRKDYWRASRMLTCGFGTARTTERE